MIIQPSLFGGGSSIPTIEITRFVSTISPVSDPQANIDIPLIKDSDLIKNHYTDSNAFALVVRLTNLDDSIGGIDFMFNSNQDFGVTSSGGSTHVYGFYGNRSSDVASNARITKPLTTDNSTSTYTLRGNANGNLIMHSASSIGALRPGQYFVMFGLMEYNSYVNLLKSTKATYVNNSCVSNSSNTYASKSNYVYFGKFPYTVPATGLPETIYVKGLAWNNTDQYCRISFYSGEQKTRISALDRNATNISDLITVTQLGNNYYKFEPVADGNSSKIYTTSNTALWFSISLYGADGADTIISYEPIE